jgi:uncharacterized protein YqcC (DUF446 family)
LTQQEQITTAGLKLSELLIDLEYVMRDSALWGGERPLDEAFASELPFAHDQMEFPQWLQFVFVPNLTELAQSEDAQWPESCAVAPMAEYYFAEREFAASRIIRILQSIDLLVTDFSRSNQIMSPG